MCLLPDEEGAQSLWLLGLHYDVVHDGPSGAVARPRDEPANVLGWPFEHRLDPAVAKIAHPSAYPVRHGHLSARVTEAHALNLTGDQHPIADHKQTLRRHGTTSQRRGEQDAQMRVWQPLPARGGAAARVMMVCVDRR